MLPWASGVMPAKSCVIALSSPPAEVSELSRARMDRMGELDAASQDVLVEVVRTLEEQQWMIRAQLPHGGA